MITLKVRNPKKDLERNLKISIIFPFFSFVGGDGDLGAKSE